jgi:hypothetical protein
MLYRETTKVTINDVEVDYIKPGIANIPAVTRWIIEGFAPTFLSADDLSKMSATEQFDEAIRYAAEINNSEVSEDEKGRVWGTALMTSEATLRYLYPTLEACFPGLQISIIEDNALNEIIALFFEHYFQLITG